ncbi:MAG TPA: HAD hydrolase family protein, partial [Chthoniobacterales bacterium]|nr:HAD hydrolase family protein [Chthoniobacterales bacterium]
MKIRLLSIDFDGTLVSRVSEPVFDEHCMKLIGELQSKGVIFSINTGRSVDLLESGLTDFEFPVRPDFILTTEREVFRPGSNGEKWEPFGDWNERCARDHAELFSSAQSVLTEVVDFV